jgi:hypothetical protein
MSHLFSYTFKSEEVEYNDPIYKYALANCCWGLLTRGASKEELTDLSDAKQALKNYKYLYQYMNYGMYISMNAISVHRMFMVNFKHSATTFWRQARYHRYDEVVRRYQQLLRVYYNFLDQATDVWKAKIEKEIGYLLNYLYNFLNFDTKEKLKADPLFMRFEGDKHKFFR